jgi:predicted lysophospholipase L1 biosynthesis ABC-type transport system permease subunit
VKSRISEIARARKMLMERPKFSAAIAALVVFLLLAGLFILAGLLAAGVDWLLD